MKREEWVLIERLNADFCLIYVKQPPIGEKCQISIVKCGMVVVYNALRCIY